MRGWSAWPCFVAFALAGMWLARAARADELRAVAKDAPIAQRRAALHVFVWDGNKTPKGGALELAGRRLGPTPTRGFYAAERVLSGAHATRRNVDEALEQLAARGYVIDVFIAAHGYPIQLADGDWTNVEQSKGLRAVRLFYTTACFGADGAEEFRRAGVRSFVGARTDNFMHVVHGWFFVKHWRNGATVEQANARANASVEKLVNVPVLGRILRWTFVPVGARGSKRREGSRPVAFGDVGTTIATVPGRAPETTRPARTRGLVGAIGN